MDRSDAHVFIATPCAGGVVTQVFMESTLQLVVACSARGTRLTLALLGQDALITRGRNTLVARFRDTDATHLLFVDADIGFAPEDVFALLAADRPVVGGLYPLRRNFWDGAARVRIAAGAEVSTASLRYVGEPCGPPDADGLLPARFAGTGFLMIRRDVIEQMIAAFPDTRCRNGHAAGADGGRELHALFETVIDPDTRDYLSEDYGFCARWRSLGGTVWLDPRRKLSHHGMAEFGGDPALRFT